MNDPPTILSNVSFFTVLWWRSSGDNLEYQRARQPLRRLAAGGAGAHARPSANPAKGTWGVRAESKTKSGKIPTRKTLPLFLASRREFARKEFKMLHALAKVYSEFLAPGGPAGVCRGARVLEGAWCGRLGDGDGRGQQTRTLHRTVMDFEDTFKGALAFDRLTGPPVVHRYESTRACLT